MQHFVCFDVGCCFKVEGKDRFRFCMLFIESVVSAYEIFAKRLFISTKITVLVEC